MSWQIIAVKEFEDAVRSRLLWGLVAVVTVMVGLTSLVPLVVPGFDGNVVVGLGAATEFAAMLVPIVALVAAYLAIAGERESGSLRLLLGLEPNRGTVVLGKFLGRSGVVAVGLAIGFTIASAITLLVYGTLPVVALAAVVGLTVALGVTFVGIAIGISAATATRSRAMTLGIGIYLVLALLWDLVPQGAHFVLEGAPPSGTVPAWFVFLQGLSPSGAYSALATAALRLADPSMPGTAQLLGGPVPFFVQWWAFALILLAWTVVPLAAGYWTFTRADLD